jgi:Transposase domain (DUF772)
VAISGSSLYCNFLEHLSDRQAVDAVRGRIDWKYLLGLELTDVGFDASVVCEFRARLIEGHAEQLLLEKMLTVFQQKGWREQPGDDNGPTLRMSWPRSALFHRVLCVWETMRFVLGSLAVVAPEWLRAHSQPEWVERYGPRSEDSRLPMGEAEREAFAEDVGRQGAHLLADLFDPAAPEWLRQLRGEWTCCGRCEYKIIIGSMMWFGGVPLRIFLRRLGISALPTMTRPMTARSAAPRGSATKSI